MKTSLCPVPAILAAVVFSAATASAGLGAPPQTVEPDLAALVDGKGGTLVNRSITRIDKEGRPAIRFDERPDHGFARIDDLTFGDGVIEFDARGQNVPQRSFLGLAFHGADDATYDAIYFRPFNFKAEDPARRRRAVQYISLPTHTWQQLRGQFPGKYENAVAPVPDPEGWFHVRVVIAAPRVSVFVNDAAEPCLVVEQLSTRRRGWIALWVDVSGGDFANLRLTPREEGNE